MNQDPEAGQVWRHRNGNRYCVIAIANASGSPERQAKYPVTVVYQNVSNRTIWARRLDDWHRSMTREPA